MAGGGQRGVGVGRAARCLRGSLPGIPCGRLYTVELAGWGQPERRAGRPLVGQTTHHDFSIVLPFIHVIPWHL